MTEGPRQSGAYDFVKQEEESGYDIVTQLLLYGESRTASAFPIFQSNTVDGLYARMRNPTIEALEEKMRCLERGALSLAFSSGMAAVSHTLLGLLRAGDRVVTHRSLFVGVQSLLSDFVAKLGIQVCQVDLNDPVAFARALDVPTRLVYFETLCNPTLEVLDAPSIIACARRTGVMVAVDNTILTPLLFKPLECGADMVIHSASKYLSGHGDALAGLVTFRDEAVGREVHKSRRLMGGLLSPLSAFLVMRGMKTLGLRVAEHCRNAQQVAEYLERHPAVTRVLYPGLPSTPGHAVAKSFLSRFGGVVSFEVHESLDWEQFGRDLRLCRPWMSFGDVGTRVQREGPVRLSVGLEDVSDIIGDLKAAFAKQAGAHERPRG